MKDCPLFFAADRGSCFPGHFLAAPFFLVHPPVRPVEHLLHGRIRSGNEVRNAPGQGNLLRRSPDNPVPPRNRLLRSGPPPPPAGWPPPRGHKGSVPGPDCIPSGRGGRFRSPRYPGRCTARPGSSAGPATSAGPCAPVRHPAVSPPGSARYRKCPPAARFAAGPGRCPRG